MTGNETGPGRWEADAREFGLHVKQGGWRLGLLVARNVEPGTAGRPPKIVSIETIFGKVSANEFGRRAGTAPTRVLRYFTAWERAAAAGHVPPPTDLTPGLELPDLDVEALPDWSGFYDATAGPNRIQDTDRGRRIREEAERAGVSVHKTDEIARNKKALAAAVRADPDAAQAAIGALASAPGTATAAAQQMLADPQVAKEVFAEPEARASFVRARNEQEAERIDRNLRGLEEKSPEVAETNRKIGQAGSKLDLEDAVSRFRSEIRRFASTVARALPGAGPYGGSAGPLSLAENITSAKAAMPLAENTLAALASYVEGNSATLEEELEKIVSEPQ